MPGPGAVHIRFRQIYAKAGGTFPQTTGERPTSAKLRCRAATQRPGAGQDQALQIAERHEHAARHQRQVHRGEHRLVAARSAAWPTAARTRSRRPGRCPGSRGCAPGRRRCREQRPEAGMPSQGARTKCGFSSMPRYRQPGARRAAICRVKAPVPGPNSTIVRADAKSIGASIARARAAELGRTAPTVRGDCTNCRRNSAACRVMRMTFALEIAADHGPMPDLSFAANSRGSRYHSSGAVPRLPAPVSGAGVRPADIGRTDRATVGSAVSA